MKLSDRKGFTLIEMLIVIAIIGILAVGLGRIIVGGPQQARDAQRKNAISQITQAIEAFNGAKGYYPSTGAAKFACVEAIEGADGVKNNGFIKYFPGGATGVPVDPSSAGGQISYDVTKAGNPKCDGYLYVKANNGTNASYMLYAKMEAAGQGNVDAANIKTDGSVPTITNGSDDYYAVIQ